MFFTDPMSRRVNDTNYKWKLFCKIEPTKKPSATPTKRPSETPTSNSLKHFWDFNTTGTRGTTVTNTITINDTNTPMKNNYLYGTNRGRLCKNPFVTIMIAGTDMNDNGEYINIYINNTVLFGMLELRHFWSRVW